MDHSTRTAVRAAAYDLERACTTIEELRRSAGGSPDGFELAEASHAAHRALLALRGWDWTPELTTAALAEVS